MTTTVKTVTRQATPRTWRDIDPKVATAAILALIADGVLIYLYATGHISGNTLAAGIGPSALSVLGAYARTSSHADLVVEGEQIANAVIALAPAAEVLAPTAKPILEPVFSTVEDIETALSTPTPTDGERSTTETITLAPSV